MLLIYFWSLAG